MHLQHFAAQFRRQFEVVDQVTLVGQRDAVGAFARSLHVEYGESGVVTRGQPGGLADHAARPFVAAVDHREEFFVAHAEVFGYLVLDFLFDA